MRLLASICAAILALAPLGALAASGPNATYGNVRVDSLTSTGPVSGTLTQATFASGVAALPSCTPGSTTAPVPAGQPFRCAGLILIAQ
jgi:hypothetical protein